MENETLLSIDPVLSNESTKRPSDDDFSDLFEKPNRKPITTNLPSSAHDPLDLTIKTAGAREKEKQWTVPGDGWDIALDAWCTLIGKPKGGMTIPTQIKLKGIFQDVGAVMKSTAPEVASAIGLYKERYDWWDDDWPSDGFTNRLGMILVPDAKEAHAVHSGYRDDSPGAV